MGLGWDDLTGGGIPLSGKDSFDPLSLDSLENNWNPLVGHPTAGTSDFWKKTTGGSGSDWIDDTLNRNQTLPENATAAQLTRAQWEDYKQRFVPVENALINETTYGNPALIGERVAEGALAVNKAYDRAGEIADRSLQRIGVARNKDQQATYDRIQNLDRSAAISDATDRILQRLQDRDREIAAGGIPNAGRSYGLRNE